MKQEDFQVVAELYQFLATFGADAIARASKLPGISENLRTALVSLHQEATKQATTSRSSPINSSEKGRNGGSLDPQELLMDKRRFPSKKALYDLADLLDMKIKEEPKESHERVARRIANFVISNPSAYAALYELVRDAKSTETSGWIDLIRRSS